MTYIINPLWFYFMDLADEINYVCGAVMICCGLAGFILLMHYVITNELYYDDNKSIHKKVFKMLACVFIVDVIIGILIPSKETMLTMMVAKFATYENAEWTLDTLKAAVDYIVNSIASMK